MRASLAIALALAAGPALKSAGAASGVTELSLAADCQLTSITLAIAADAWIDENSPFANKGSDSILDVDAGSPPDPTSGLPSGRARALVRFELPGGAPEGCVVESARLRLFAPEDSAGDRAEVLPIAAEWSENAVTWSNQPEAIGPAVTAWLRQGYVQWNVTAQVQAMFDGAANHGFLVRDAAEGAEGGAGYSFHAKEKGDGSPRPELVIRFGPPPSGEPPPIAEPVDAFVSCGEELRQSTRVVNDLFECPGDGLVIGAARIIVDLNGHTIDGVGLGTGIRNDGYAEVTVRNGTVQQFDYGVQLLSETKLNVVDSLTLQQNELAGVELFDAGRGGEGNVIRANVFDGNGDAIVLVSGTTGTLVVDNAVTLSRGWGLRVRDSEINVFSACDNVTPCNNVIANNSFTDGGDLGVGLERASGNWLGGNTVSGHSDLGIGLQQSSYNRLRQNIINANSDGGVEIRALSNYNVVELNELDDSGDHGILVDSSDGNALISNRAHGMSDNGIFLSNAHLGEVRGNDVRFNTGGLEIDGSGGNLIQGNNASETTGIGIELGTGSLGNRLLENTASANLSHGIYVLGDTLSDPGNLLEGNVASRNMADGIVTAGGGHKLTANIANDNAGWGMNAAPGTIAGGGNRASGNGKPEQCIGIVCNDVTPPETQITDGPPPMSGSSLVSISFSGSDSQTSTLVFECRLDSLNEEDYHPCSSPASYAVAEGDHRFDVRAVDAAGNTDASPAVHVWTTVKTCPAPATVVASADAWIDQSALSLNKGPDSILKVRSQSGSANFRALVQFVLPELPDGCKVESATLQMYSSSAFTGRILRAVRIAQPWAEDTVTWGNQPLVTGGAASTPSGLGFRSWNVQEQVQSMYDNGQFGFLIRDAAENGSGAEQSFHAREKGENVPVLVLRFVAGS